MLKQFLRRVVFIGFLSAFAVSPICSSVVAAKTVTVLKKKTKRHRYVSVSAIKGADERNFTDATTRCLTKELKSLNATKVKLMQQDLVKTNADGSEEARLYKEKLALGWAAMSEPYCGFGSRGVAAAKKSYLKTVERARSEFLEKSKKGLTAIKVTTATLAMYTTSTNPLGIRF